MNTPLKYSRLIVFFFLALIVSACHDDDETPKTGPANRTVLVYMMAENSLSKYAEEGGSLDSDIQEMIQGASSIPDNDHLIVFLDDADASQKPRIYEIKKATKKKEAQAELVREYTEEVCSTDPAVLEEVLNYVKRNYPAKGYGLVMWSHGSGWLPARQKKDSRSIGVDNEHNSKSPTQDFNTGIEMEISDLAEVIAGFGKLDFLYFDACYMQGIEVAYELRGVTDYVIGCPAETPALGARYDKIIPPMFAPVADIKGIVNNNFNYYLSIYNTNTKNDAENYGCLMSAIKCSELDALAEMTAPIISNYASNQHLLTVNSNVQMYCAYASETIPEFYDFQGVIHAISTESEYTQWLSQFDKAVICRVHTNEWFGSGSSWGNNWLKFFVDDSVSPHGIVSMYVPKNNPFYAKKKDGFQKTRWYAAVWGNTGW